jgi:protein O-mannosyl-transferase
LWASPGEEGGGAATKLRDPRAARAEPPCLGHGGTVESDGIQGGSALPRKPAATGNGSRAGEGAALGVHDGRRRGLHAARWFAALLLLVTILGVFAPARDFGFVDYDDSLYVSQVPIVQRGLTAEGVRWAFTTFQAGNWHPLTWLSLMADTSLFGQNPGHFHRTNIAFHVANALLLFAILGWLTGAFARSFFTAELFALHPFHVESVVWVAERKDVLSTFFGLLAIGAYVAYTRGPSTLRYGALFAAFALSLMAKPMWVTLPLLLLLLDFWPLGRLPWLLAPKGENRATRKQTTFLRRARPLVLEKLPLLGLSLASSLITYRAQSFGGALTSELGTMTRLENALVSLVWYLWKAALPLNLAVYYPYHLPIGPLRVALSSAALALLTGGALWLRRRCPFFFVGWLWYLVALLPVMGLVQVGTQAMADRYTYVPLIGIFLAAVWGTAELGARLRIAPEALAGLGALVITLLGAEARAQVLVWKDERVLFEHAIAVAGGSSTAYNGLGVFEAHAGNFEAAERDFHAAKQYFPEIYQAPLNAGLLASLEGRIAEAEHEYQEAIALDPARPDAYYSLALVYLRAGRIREAVPWLEKVLELDPEYPTARELLEKARSAQVAADGAAPPPSGP